MKKFAIAHLKGGVGKTTTERKPPYGALWFEIQSLLTDR